MNPISYGIASSYPSCEAIGIWEGFSAGIAAAICVGATVWFAAWVIRQ